MPFKKVGKNNYVSPSGRHFNGAQVRLWYAGGGKFPGQKQSEEPKMSKGSGPKDAAYAQGGAVLQKQSSIFMKTPDTFRGGAQDQSYGKGGGGNAGGLAGNRNPTPKDKSEKAVKPRG